MLLPCHPGDVESAAQEHTLLNYESTGRNAPYHNRGGEQNHLVVGEDLSAKHTAYDNRTRLDSAVGTALLSDNHASVGQHRARKIAVYPEESRKFKVSTKKSTGSDDRVDKRIVAGSLLCHESLMPYDRPARKIRG